MSDVQRKRRYETERDRALELIRQIDAGMRLYAARRSEELRDVTDEMRAEHVSGSQPGLACHRGRARTNVDGESVDMFV
jgi:hypothetical protein